jgi:D-lactate dehydrogenase
MKVAFFEIKDWEKEYLKQRLKDYELVFFKDTLNPDTLTSVLDSDIISIFIYSHIDKKVLAKFKNLKAVVTRSTGFDHINLNDCKKKKINVYNVPNYGQNTVAEHTFALILSLSRKIHKAYEKTIRGNFSLENLEGFDLKGKTIGIVGMGSIGRHVAKIANGFEMNVLAYDLYPDKKLEKELGLKFVPLDKLLKESDIVSLHCPYNKETHHLINDKNIKMMKKGALLINTARGALVDTGSLVKALASKYLGGAGLDVLEEEGFIKEEAQLLSLDFPKKKLENLLENHLLLTFDNVIITPHIAFYSEEALKRILDITIDNIRCIADNKKSGALVKIK